jgi:hypothetical protein
MADSEVIEGVVKHALNTVVSSVIGAVLAIWRSNKKSGERFAQLMSQSKAQHDAIIARVDKLEEDFDERLDETARVVERQRTDASERVRVIEQTLWGHDGKEGLRASTGEIIQEQRRQHDALSRLTFIVEALYTAQTGKRAPVASSNHSPDEGR